VVARHARWRRMPEARSQSRREHGGLPAAMPGNYAVCGWLTLRTIDAFIAARKAS